MRLRRFICVYCAALILASSSVLPSSYAEGGEDEKIALPIVMYHQLSKKASMLNDYILYYEQFENDLKYLHDRGFETVTVERLLAWSRGEAELPEKPMMITFDDGYETTKEYAGPLLEKYGFTAVVAVVATVADQFTQLPDRKLDYAHLCWEELREMSRGGTFEIQCHTYNMHKLSLRRGCGKMRGEDPDSYREKLENDLRQFNQRCDENGVVTCGAIAFPYGYYSSETLQVVKDLGFTAAFTCTQKVNYLSRDPYALYELCRFNRPNGKISRDFFAKWE